MRSSSSKVVYDDVIRLMVSSGLYRVTVDGRIETCRRWNGRRDVEVPWYICDRDDGKGYLYVSHRMARVKAHRLAYCLHHPDEQLDGAEINHIHPERGTRDNREDNLEKCDAKRQSDHAYEAGLNWALGERHFNSKLTDDAVRIIRNTPIRHGTIIQLARKYGVTPRVIRLVVNNETWKHVS